MYILQKGLHCLSLFVTEEQKTEKHSQHKSSSLRCSSSSSPTLIESEKLLDTAGIWRDGITHWSSSTELNRCSSESTSKVVFMLGDPSSDEDILDLTHSYSLGLPGNSISIFHPYLPALQRTSTMPDLHMVSCP